MVDTQVSKTCDRKIMRVRLSPSAQYMRKQQKIWELEHNKKTTLPSMASLEPSNGVVRFFEYLQKSGIKPPLKVVDIGSGKGRNAIYLGKEGFDVYCMDYIKEALDFTEKQARKNNVSDKIHLYKTLIDEKWPFEDDFFDLSIDSFSSIDIETKKGREIYKKELKRTLKPEGLALIQVVSANDAWEAKLIKENPGKEPNSTIWPQNGKFQKDYDERELRHFYKEFDIIELKEITKQAFKLGKNFKATNFWLILRKK